MNELADLRSRELAVSNAIDERRRELEALSDEIQALQARLPALRERAAEKKRKEYGSGGKVLISACVVPPALLVGALSGLFGWSFLAIPGLMFELDSGLMLMVLPVALGLSALIAAAYALIKIWT